MGNDALDRVWKPFGKEQRREYAKMKAAEEESRTLNDRRTVARAVSQFNETIQRQRREAGLE